MTVIRHLPGNTAHDLVGEIRVKRENAKAKRNRERCFGTPSCDCRRCVTPSPRPGPRLPL